MVLSHNSFRKIAILLMLVSCCQAMAFVYVRSSRCQGELLPKIPGSLDACQLGQGSRTVLAACSFWFAASLATAHLNRLSVVENQLKKRADYFSMMPQTGGPS